MEFAGKIVPVKNIPFLSQLCYHSESGIWPLLVVLGFILAASV